MKKSYAKKYFTSIMAGVFVFGLAATASAFDFDAAYVAGDTWQSQSQNIVSDQYGGNGVAVGWGSITFFSYDGAYQGTSGNQSQFGWGLALNGDYDADAVQVEGYNTVMPTAHGWIANSSFAGQSLSLEVDGFGYAEGGGYNDFAQGTEVWNNSATTFTWGGVTNVSNMGTANYSTLEMGGAVFTLGNASADYDAVVQQNTSSYQEVAVPGGSGFTFSSSSQSGEIHISAN